MISKNSRLTGCFLALGLLLAHSTIAQAASEQSTTAEGYVDSVYNWGSWELGLEPAAGGPVALPESAMSNRPADVRFRPNDNSVFGVGSQGLATVTPNPTPVPTYVAPPISPGTAPPGGPGDRF